MKESGKDYLTLFEYTMAKNLQTTFSLVQRYRDLIVKTGTGTASKLTILKVLFYKHSLDTFCFTVSIRYGCANCAALDMNDIVPPIFVLRSHFSITLKC